MKAREPTTQRILPVFTETKTGAEIRNVENRKGHKPKWKGGVASRKPRKQQDGSSHLWVSDQSRCLDTCHPKKKNAQIKDVNGGR